KSTARLTAPRRRPAPRRPRAPCTAGHLHHDLPLHGRDTPEHGLQLLEPRNPGVDLANAALDLPERDLAEGLGELLEQTSDARSTRAVQPERVALGEHPRGREQRGGCRVEPLRLRDRRWLLLTDLDDTW